MLQYDAIFDPTHRILLSYSCQKTAYGAAGGDLLEKTSTSGLKVPANDQLIIPLSKSHLESACKTRIV